MDAIDRYFQEQRAFIGRCEDVSELVDCMADYRDEERAASARGATKARMRLSDLLDLAEDRVVALKARSMRQRVSVPRETERGRREDEHFHQPRAIPPSRKPDGPPPVPERDRLDAEREARRHAERQQRAAEQEAERQRQEIEQLIEERRQAQEQAERVRQAAEERAESRRRAAEERAAAVERERAELRRLRAELEQAEAARLRAEDERQLAEARALAAERAEAARRLAEEERLASEERAMAAERANLERQAALLSAQPASPWAGSTRAPDSSVGAATVTAVGHGQVATEASPMPSGRSSPATTPSLTAHLPAPAPAQSPTVPAAATMVDAGPTVAGASPVQPAAVPALPYSAATRASDPPSAATAESGASPPDQRSHTGADLVAYRAQQTVSQRALAEALGVAPGTISKAETRPTKPLSPYLQTRFEAVLRGARP